MTATDNVPVLVHLSSLNEWTTFYIPPTILNAGTDEQINEAVGATVDEPKGLFKVLARYDESGVRFIYSYEPESGDSCLIALGTTNVEKVKEAFKQVITNIRTKLKNYGVQNS